MNEIYFDNKLISFDRKITSNKTKYLEAQKKLNSLTTKEYDIFLDRIYFTSNQGSQKTFFLSTNPQIRIKKKQRNLAENENKYLMLNLGHYILLPYIKISEQRMEIKFDNDPLVVELNNYLTKM